MKSVEYYMNLPYRLEIIPDTEEGGFVAHFPDLPGCITIGDSMEEVLKNILDAKRLWLENAIADGREIMEPNNLENYSGQFKLRMPKSLHKQLAENSKREGISMNQYCLYLLSRNDALHCK